jgi:hypothetical protein
VTTICREEPACTCTCHMSHVTCTCTCACTCTCTCTCHMLHMRICDMLCVGRRALSGLDGRRDATRFGWA